MTPAARASRARRLLAVVVTAAFVLSTRPARAEDVRVVAADPNDPLVERIARELELMGLTVTRGAPAATARDLVVLEIGDDAIELQESLERGARRRRRLASKRDAVEIAEEVHALLLPLVGKAPAPGSPAAAPRSAEGPAPEPARAPRAFGERDVEISAGTGALFGGSTPGISISPAAALFPRALRARRFAFGASAGAIVAALPERVSGEAGSTDVRAYVGTAEVIARFGGASAKLLDAALGVSVNHVTFAGAAKEPFTSKDERATSVSPTLRVRGTYATGRVGLFLDARLGVAFPEVAVRFAGAEVATWGRPWGCLGAGVALGF